MQSFKATLSFERRGEGGAMVARRSSTVGNRIKTAAMTS